MASTPLSSSGEEEFICGTSEIVCWAYAATKTIAPSQISPFVKGVKFFLFISILFISPRSLRWVRHAYIFSISSFKHDPSDSTDASLLGWKYWKFVNLSCGTKALMSQGVLPECESLELLF